MPVRSRSQRIGDAGQNFVRETVDSHRNWMCRAQDLDFGVDLEAELAPTEGDDQQPLGKLLKLQVKSSERLAILGHHVTVSLERAFLEYSKQFRIPVVLIVVEPSSKRAWWLWLQEWLLDHEVRLAAKPKATTATLHIPLDQTLEEGLNGSWRPIALGQAASAMVLAIREIVTIASNDLDHAELLSGALDLLDKLQPKNRTWAAEKIIDTLIGLGPHAGYWQSAQYIRPLMLTVERLGDSFTIDQVVRMVHRGDSYSRAGLAGLAQFYDKWPEHARRMALPATFKAAGSAELEWYCSARERYPEFSSIDLWMEFAGRRLPETHFGNVELSSDEELSDRLWGKWPTRGDSVLLDNLKWVGERVSEKGAPSS